MDDLEIIILSEVKRRKTNMILFICEILKKIINRIAYILNHPFFKRTFPMTQMVKNLPAIQETQV